MQHRAYQPILPCGNKYLQQKWDRTHYEMHQKKVKSAKPTISTGPPQPYGHLQLKLKKLKLEEERMSIIQRDNKMLLDKISFIMRTTGHIDNRNNYENRREKRQQELLRVSKENQVIVERLSRCGPRYSTRQWHEDWLRTEEYRESIARYPRSASLIKARPKSIKQTAKEAKGDKSGQERSGDNAPGDKNSKSGEIAETDERKGSDGERDAETKNSESDSDSDSDSDKHD